MSDVIYPFTRAARKYGREAALLMFDDPAAQPKHFNSVETTELVWGPPRVIRTEYDFRDYQDWMANKMIEQDCLVAAEMGLGKTAATLWAIRVLLDRGEINHCLIVAPLNVAEDTWPEEIQTWTFARDFEYRVITGTEDQRLAALNLPAQITIINRENLHWFYQHYEGRKWPYDMLVYDEASRLKRGVKRTATRRLTELGILRRKSYRFKRKILLSGTPASNGLIDLWGPIYVIDEGKRLGNSITAYKRRWFREDRYTNKVEPFEHSEKEIMKRVEDVMFSLRASDYLDLPDLVEVEHEVHLSYREMAMYRELEKEFELEFESLDGDDALVEASNAAVLTNKLLQFANGSLYVDEDVSKPVHNHKLDMLESIVEEAAGRPILCAYSYQFDRDAIKKRFKFARVYGEGENDKRDWNAGRIPLMILHPGSAGHGLNFQHGSNIACWYGLTWSLELFQQFNARLHRSGQQEDKVFLHYILARHTADRRVLEALQRKGATQRDILDAVRVELGRLAA